MRIGIALRQEVAHGEDPARTVRRLARRAERRGFDGLWTHEGLRGPAQSLEPLSLLAAAAVVTRRVELGVATLLPLHRDLIQLARATATLDWLSGGRLVVGVALGDRAIGAALGSAGDRRVGRFVDGLTLLRRLWTEQQVTADGPAATLRAWSPGLRPPRPDGPPLWFGGHHPDALRRAVRLGDGWIGAGGSSIPQFLADLAVVRDVMAETARSRPFGVGKRVYLAVGRRPRHDRQRLRDWFARRYRDPDRADRVAVAGDPPALLDAVAPLVEAGVDLLILNPLFDEQRQYEVLAAEVVPALRALRR